MKMKTERMNLGDEVNLSADLIFLPWSGKEIKPLIKSFLLGEGKSCDLQLSHKVCVCLRQR